MVNADKPEKRTELVQGTLDMLILRTLRFQPTHGHGIVQSIGRLSEDVLQVDHGSLYPALQRLQREGFLTATWGTTENNRRAKYYRITKSGQRQLVKESDKWERLTRAIAQVMSPPLQEEG